jgi:hypothetical protein
MEPPSTIVDILLMKHLTLIQIPYTVIVSLDAEHYVIVKHRPMTISQWYYSDVVFVALWKSVQLSKGFFKCPSILDGDCCPFTVTVLLCNFFPPLER